MDPNARFRKHRAWSPNDQRMVTNPLHFKLDSIYSLQYSGVYAEQPTVMLSLEQPVDIDEQLAQLHERNLRYWHNLGTPAQKIGLMLSMLGISNWLEEFAQLPKSIDKRLQEQIDAGGEPITAEWIDELTISSFMDVLRSHHGRQLSDRDCNIQWFTINVKGRGPYQLVLHYYGHDSLEPNGYLILEPGDTLPLASVLPDLTPDNVTSVALESAIGDREPKLLTDWHDSEF